MVIYLSRDSFVDGTPLPGIQVWNERPDRIRDPDGVFGFIWKRGIASWIATLTIEEAKKHYPVIPETDLELIRISVPD